MNIYTSEYETVIGLEVHAELKTSSKIFCSCSTDFGAEPNTQVCPICLGLPGTLPTLNKRALELAVRAGLSLNCTIAEVSGFDRKNYFYPDLPKAYQITQFERPICTDGSIEIETANEKKTVGITRIHMEEDAGKLIHRGDRTLIDCNRCGVPLIEIVSEPDIRSAEEAVAYLKALRAVLLFGGVCDGKMNEGSLRCDVNLSVRRPGEPMGTRCEIKNLNSFKFIEKAIEYEAKRQIAVLESGGTVLMETRRFDENEKKTFPMRKKESQSDYRFFPEPDLPPVVLTDRDIKRIKSRLPRLPHERMAEYSSLYSIPADDCKVLTSEPETADYFEKCAACTRFPRTASNLIITELMGIARSGESIVRILPENIGKLSDMMGDELIGSATAKRLIREMWEQDFDPAEKAEREGLYQINDEETLLGFVRAAIAKSEKAVEDYKKGKESAIKSIIGRAMGESRGRANPATVACLTEKLLSEI
ncbi:MAG: Asp-tRNA(Asn)/Glu-tRNA(Gln) amidotransferase subunit GatB [Clostridia bacterium]|nr:Asp-tRNA(Asn)/Glu-tRNA(Gln) amidotransferase subunit GatB [Clostridia bacterium]